jgi:hypothetical protein
VNLQLLPAPPANERIVLRLFPFRYVIFWWVVAFFDAPLLLPNRPGYPIALFAIIVGLAAIFRIIYTTAQGERRDGRLATLHLGSMTIGYFDAIDRVFYLTTRWLQPRRKNTK